jgi:hypothetical protein
MRAVIVAVGLFLVAAHVQVAGGPVSSVEAAARSGLDPVSNVLHDHRDMPVHASRRERARIAT